MVATWRRRPGMRWASSMTVGARLKIPHAPSTRLTAAVDWPVARPGKLLATAAKISTIHRLSSMVRSIPALRSRAGIAVDSLRGRRVGRRPAGRSEALFIGRAGAACVSSRLTVSAMLIRHARMVADRLAHSREPSGASALPDEGLVTMPHHPLLQANACMPRSWKLQAAVSLPPIAASHPDRPDELAAGAAALRDGRIPDAVAAYDRALAGLSPDGHAEQRGAALLARGLAHQLLGDASRASADVLAALNVWSLARADWASSAMSDLAAALSGANNAVADAYWQAALRLAERRGDVVLQAAVAGEWGRHAARAGDSVTAVALLEKSAELGRRAGDDAIVAKARVNVARVELDAGRGGHAMRNIGEALARDQRGDLRAATAGLLVDVAAEAFHSGDAAHAALCLEQALSLSGGADRQIRERTLAALSGLARSRGDLPAAALYGEELFESARRA